MDYSILFNDPLFTHILGYIEKKEFLEPPKAIAIGEIKLFEMSDLQKSIYTSLRHQQKEVQDDYKEMIFGEEGKLDRLRAEYITKYSEAQVLEILMWYLIRRQAKQLQASEHEFILGIRKGWHVIIVSPPAAN